MHDHAYLNALNRIPGVGSQKLHLLLNHFTNAQEVWRATQSDLIAAGIAEKLATTIVQSRTHISVEEEWDKLSKEHIAIISQRDPHFPGLLTTIPNPPFLLYCRGNQKALAMPSIAVVGARKYSPYGKQACYKLSFDLAQAGISIVSGLALGIDAIAHRSALDAQATTIGVLGGSVDDASITPRTNVALAHEIIARGGALISEYAIPTQPNKGTFPARNRIMAGLTQATLIIEAMERSGTLITAELAKQFERFLFAVPGSIFAQQSVGTHTLIDRGDATIVQSASQIIDAIGINTVKTQSRTTPHTAESPEEQKILDLLQEYSDGLSIDRIIRITTLDATDASSTLMLMEVRGMVKNIGSQKYVLL